MSRFPGAQQTIESILSEIKGLGGKVRIKHYRFEPSPVRVYSDGRVRFRPLKNRRVENEQSGKHSYARKAHGLTTAIVTLGDKTFKGHSICSHGDTYHGDIGAAIALKNVYRKI